MMPMNSQTRVLFVPPRLAEERKQYWSPQGYSQPDIASSLKGFGLGALRGLGDAAGDTVMTIYQTFHNGVTDLIGTVTGQKGQAQAQQNALELARLKSAQAAVEAEARAEGWGAATPWLVIGGAVVVVAVVFAARKK